MTSNLTNIAPVFKDTISKTAPIIKDTITQNAPIIKDKISNVISNVAPGIFSSEPVVTFADRIEQVVHRLFYARMLASLIVIIWTWYIISSLLDVPFNPVDWFTKKKEFPHVQSTQQEIDRKFYMHRVLFGDNSVVMILFHLWYIAIILFVLGPLIGIFLKKLHIRN